MRVAIALDEEEQDWVLASCGYIDKVPQEKRRFSRDTPSRIAQKILRAREDPFLNEETE
jgi:hypothetical protein